MRHIILKKSRLNQRIDFSFILPTTILSVVFFCTSLVIAQNNLNDHFYKIRVLQKIDSLLLTKYVYPGKAEKYAREFKKKYESGIYDGYQEPKEFAGQITADLITITKDKHFNFRFVESSAIGEKPESALHHPIRYYQLGIKENQGFSKLEWIEGQIGYLDIRRFYTFPDIKDRAVAAIKFLSNASAIIIDLRENGGGSGDYLSSYFLNYPSQLTGWYSREDDFLTESWTIKETGIIPLSDVPLFLLTSDRTFSAAESFAYDMKVYGRAVLVGDSTKGGAHAVDLYKIDDQFEIYIPTVRAINPITAGNWEGTGVIPDILVPSDAALDTAISLARKAGADYAKTKEVKLKFAVDKMQNQLTRAEILFRENKTASAETVLDSIFQIAEIYHLINEFFIDVLAYNYYAQEDERILYAILTRKITYFPNAPSAYETLAYAYYKNNRKEQAITTFEKVLGLDPDNRNALRMIQRIKAE